MGPQVPVSHEYPATTMRPSGCTATARATNVSGLVSVETLPSPEKEASRSPGAAPAGGAYTASAASAAARRRTLTSMSSATLPVEHARPADHAGSPVTSRRSRRSLTRACAPVTRCSSPRSSTSKRTWRTRLPFAAVGAPRPRGLDAAAAAVRPLQLDEGHDRMVAEFFGALDVRAMLPGFPGRRRVAARPDRPRELGVRLDAQAQQRRIPLARVASGSPGSRTSRSAPSSRPSIAARATPASGRSGRRAAARGALPHRHAGSARGSGRAVAAADAALPHGRRARAAEPDAEALVYVSFGSVTAGEHLPLLPRALPRGDRGARAAARALPAHDQQDRDHARARSAAAQRHRRALGAPDDVLHACRRRRHARRPRLDTRRARPRRPAVGAAAVRARPVVQRRRGRPRRRRRRARRRAPHAPRDRPAERRDARRAAPCGRARAERPGPAPATRSIAAAMRALPSVDDAAAALEESPR